MLLAFALAGAGTVGGFLASRSYRPVTFDQTGARFGGWLAPAGPASGPIRLTGMAGRPMELEVGGQTLGRFASFPDRCSWDYASVSWLGDTVAGLWGVDVIDQRPADDWIRWETDPLFRAEVKWDDRLASNRRSYRSLHAHEPAAPRGYEANPSGVEARLSTGSDDGSKRTWARLKVLVDGREKMLIKRKIAKNGGVDVSNLLWVAEHIQAGMGSTSRRAEGTTADVPDALRGIRAISDGEASR